MADVIINPHPPQIRQSIGLQTRQGIDIANSQILNFIPDARFYHQIRTLREKYIGIIERPNTTSAIYNCHGMTFACKRTGIDENAELIKILNHDNYVKINNLGHILHGDIVLYKATNGEIEHSGIVLLPPDSHDQLPTTLVLSKWGDGYEIIHRLYNCPYEKGNICFYRCEN